MYNNNINIITTYKLSLVEVLVLDLDLSLSEE